MQISTARKATQAIGWPRRRQIRNVRLTSDSSTFNRSPPTFFLETVKLIEF
jgi:hypothetical protein